MNSHSISRSIRAILFAAGVICAFLHLRSANADEVDTRPELMITVGDSMSAAFIATTHAEKPEGLIEGAVGEEEEKGSQADGLSFKHRLFFKQRQALIKTNPDVAQLETVHFAIRS